MTERTDFQKSLHIYERPLKDRDQIYVGKFLIQKTTGRDEITLWVKGHGWITAEQLSVLVNGDE